MRILRLVSYWYPEMVASSHIHYSLNEAFEAEGIINEVYTPVPTRGIDEATKTKYKKIKYEETNNGYVKIHRFSMFGESKGSLQRAFRYMLCTIRQLYNGLKAKDIDVCFMSSTPPINGIIMSVLKKFRKYKIVYSLQDIFPDSLVYTGITNKGSLLWKIGQFIEKITYKAADKIIVISEDFKKNIMAKGVPEEKIEVIYNWIDTHAVKPITREENKLFEEFNIQRTKFIVVYAGNMGAAQGTEIIFDVAEKLKDNTDIQFVIFGGGSGLQSARKIVKNRQLNNVIINGLLPQERVSEVYSLGDIALITCKKGSGSSAMPSKTWSIMSAERAVLASFDKGTDLDKIVTENNCGICVEAGDCNALVDAINKLCADRENLQKMGQNGREYVLKNLTKEIGTSKVINVLRSV